MGWLEKPRSELSVAFAQPASVSAGRAHSVGSQEAACSKARPAGQVTRALPPSSHPDLEKVQVARLVSHLYDIGDQRPQLESH